MSQGNIELPGLRYSSSNPYERDRARRAAAKREAESEKTPTCNNPISPDELPPEGPRRILPGEVINTPQPKRSKRSGADFRPSLPFHKHKTDATHSDVAGVSAKVDKHAPARRSAKAEESIRQEKCKERARVSQSIPARIVGFVTATPGRIKGCIALAIVVLLFFAMYPPLRDYYVACRTQEDLKTQYAQLKDKNGELLSDIERLQTSEGIEDEARKRGYVNQGETGVVVEGLDGSGDSKKSNETVSAQDARKPTEETKTINTGSFQQKLLDFIFQYHREDLG
ncbi:septum formation initiator family protein [Atopobium sp. oral taxon 810]|uniref:FtsB family cell division protein n=1 Tax=Atopobium sp. oral taxon 810 TaxID=712158 RepID=UPI00040B9186|nr:septum formation initiator family protein [Atopobium sp. oral taxon 810]